MMPSVVAGGRKLLEVIGTDLKVKLLLAGHKRSNTDGLDM